MLKNVIGSKRSERGLTQQQLADRLGWSLRKLTSYERGERVPSVVDALQIAKSLNAKIEDLWRIEQ